MIMVIVLSVLFLLLQAADIWTTNRVLAQGGRELNPVMRYLQDELGMLWWLPKAMAAGLIIAVAFLMTAASWALPAVLLGGLVAFYSKIVWGNWRAIK